MRITVFITKPARVSDGHGNAAEGARVALHRNRRTFSDMNLIECRSLALGRYRMVFESTGAI